MSVTGAVTKNKDGVPQWSGDAATFNEYEEQCLLYEQGTEYYKRYMVAPRLISELQGPARRLVLGRKPDWVSFDGGVQVLLTTLRASLGKPQVSELADYLTKYFKQTKRKSQESMPDYITRKCETYLRAQQALQRVQPHHGHKKQTASSDAGWNDTWSRRVSVDSNASGGTASQAAAPISEATAHTSGNWDDDAATEAAHEDSEWQWGGWHQGWSWNQSGSRGYGWGHRGWNDSWGAPANQLPTPLIEILPDFVQGWYLLYDSGLSTTERNMIHTAVQGDYSLQRVAQELRSQWDEHNLRQRDGHVRTHAGYMGYEKELETDDDEGNPEGYQVEDLNEEGQALVAEAEGEAQQALAAIVQAKRTLREARARQHQVKLSRQYYRAGPPKGFGGSHAKGGPPRTGVPPDDSKMTCLKCGRIGHRAANCPKKERPEGQAQVNMESEPEHAPFICYCEQAFTTYDAQAYMTTQEAVQRGWCVVDGGATKTLGSITAVQNVLDQNTKYLGNSRLLHVDTERQPVFSFGNSSENRCASTIELGIQAAERDGKITIHTLDAGMGPVLLSISTLRALGAVIDFSEDLICFRSVDPKRIIRAKRSQSGHQLLPLCGDMCEASVMADRAIPSLRDFIP